MSLSRVIQREEITEIQPWRLAELEKPVEPTTATEVQPQPATVRLPSAEKIAEIQAQAHQEGFARGRQEGLEAGAVEIRASVGRLDDLMASLASPFKQLDLQVEQELLALVSALTRQLVRRQVTINPGEIIPVIRQAMAALPVAARDVRLYLNPEDASLVRESLSLTEEERCWKIVDDPVLTRGDCRVVSDTSQIDAGLESRLNALMAALLGGQRTAEDTCP